MEWLPLTFPIRVVVVAAAAVIVVVAAVVVVAAATVVVAAAVVVVFVGAVCLLLVVVVVLFLFFFCFVFLFFFLWGVVLLCFLLFIQAMKIVRSCLSLQSLVLKSPSISALSSCTLLVMSTLPVSSSSLTPTCLSVCLSARLSV